MDIKLNLPVVVLDLEMSGTNVQDHQILEIGARLCDERNFGTLNTFQSYVGPDNYKTPERVLAEGDPASLGVCKITADKIRYSKNIKEVLENLAQWLPHKFVWVGYDTYLDFAFLKKYVDLLFNGNHRIVSCKRLDLKQFIDFSTSITNAEGSSLVKAAEALGVEPTNAHTAAGDCKIVQDLLKTLFR